MQHEPANSSYRPTQSAFLQRTNVKSFSRKRVGDSVIFSRCEDALTLFFCNSTLRNQRLGADVQVSKFARAQVPLYHVHTLVNDGRRRL